MGIVVCKSNFTPKLLNILVKCIFKMLIKFNYEFCVIIDFPYDLFILVKQPPS